MIVTPVFQLYSHNIHELRAAVLLRPLLIAGLVNLFLWGLLFLFEKTRRKASLLLTVFWFFFFSHGHIGRFLFSANVPLLFEAVFVLVYLSLTVYLLRINFSQKAIHQLIASILGLLLILPLFNTLKYALNRGVAHNPDTSLQLALPQNLQNSIERGGAQDAKPDIYYLIFDRYASTASLRQYLRFDNGDFESELKKRGFYIADKSMANYPYTFLSLASSLNMRYLEDLSRFRKSKDETLAYQLIKDALVPRYLKAQGYKYIHVGNWWGPTRENSLVDRVVPYDRIPLLPVNMNDFELQLLQNSWLFLPLSRIMASQSGQARTDPHALEYLKARNQIKALKETALERGPKFVFCHFLLTHPPYLFAADGSMNPLEKSRTTDDPAVYLDSVRFANSQILEIVDAIDRSGGKEALIIIQSDEGPYSTLIKADREWKSERTRLRFRAQIFNAVRIPGVDEKKLYSQMSPVNTFRLVFNTLFAADIPTLPDRIFFIVNPRDIYRFREDTVHLRRNEEYFETHAMNE